MVLYSLWLSLIIQISTKKSELSSYQKPTKTHLHQKIKNKADFLTKMKRMRFEK